MRVTIKPFRMGKYEVTVGQFRRFVEAAGYRADAKRGESCYPVTERGKAFAKRTGRYWRKPGFPQTERDPVVCVSWNDAEAYAGWLSRQDGGRRYRLPSESEWEYAVRAGGRTRYSFGDSEAILCQYGNFADRTAKRQFSTWASTVSCDDGVLYTAPVGSYRPYGFGLHDMHGNAWEWTEDCYHDSYAGAPLDGAAWTAGDCAERVIRGAAWDLAPAHSRASDRIGFSAGRWRDNLRFRLAQDR